MKLPDPFRDWTVVDYFAIVVVLVVCLSNRSPFRRSLDVRGDRLVRFVDRDQGLILPRRNPARVKGLPDIAAGGLRFVNRQRGSGTRLRIDQILADAGIDPTTINGFGSEDFQQGAGGGIG